MGRRLYYLTRDCWCIVMASSTSHSLTKFEPFLTISKEEEQHIKLGSNLTSKYESSTSTLANKEVARRRKDIGRVVLKHYEHFTKAFPFAQNCFSRLLHGIWSGH